jgi:protein-S-isoprenylcysteine O-methyltransferase Ste14
MLFVQSILDLISRSPQKMKLLRLFFVVALFACLGTALAAPKAPMSTQAKFENAMAYLTYILLGLSVAGATLTILTFLIFSRIRTYPIKLICWLCLTIAVGQLLFIIVSFTAKGTPWCEPAAALIHFWFMANFCWVRP